MYLQKKMKISNSKCPNNNLCLMTLKYQQTKNMFYRQIKATILTRQKINIYYLLYLLIYYLNYL